MVPVQVLRLLQDGDICLPIRDALRNVADGKQAPLLLCVHGRVELDLEVGLKGHPLLDPVHHVGLLLLRVVEHDVVRVHVALVARREPGDHQGHLLVQAREVGRPQEGVHGRACHPGQRGGGEDVDEVVVVLEGDAAAELGALPLALRRLQLHLLLRDLQRPLVHRLLPRAKHAGQDAPGNHQVALPTSAAAAAVVAPGDPRGAHVALEGLLHGRLDLGGLGGDFLERVTEVGEGGAEGGRGLGEGLEVLPREVKRRALAPAAGLAVRRRGAGAEGGVLAGQQVLADSVVDVLLDLHGRRLGAQLVAQAELGLGHGALALSDGQGHTAPVEQVPQRKVFVAAVAAKGLLELPALPR
mmetsp:Transcript_3333/g.7426  ORF Transcript_3333/g.7426 Transcript_3333/m.7426 type:complete len:356 (-) Transcript_3333:189-1256(-)